MDIIHNVQRVKRLTLRFIYKNNLVLFLYYYKVIFIIITINWNFLI